MVFIVIFRKMCHLGLCWRKEENSSGQQLLLWVFPTSWFQNGVQRQDFLEIFVTSLNDPNELNTISNWPTTALFHTISYLSLAAYSKILQRIGNLTFFTGCKFSLCFYVCFEQAC